MAFKLARVSAALGFAACVVGAARAVVIIRANTGAPPDALFLWTLVPFLCAAVVLLASGRQTLATVWVPIGTCWGFVLLASWSFGLFFFWAAVCLLMAGVLYAVENHGRQRIGFIPIWFFLGATGLCPVFLMYHQLLALWSGGQIIEARAIVGGTWIFTALTLAVIGSFTRSRRVTLRG